MSKSFNDFIYQEDPSQNKFDETFDDFDFISNYSRHTSDKDSKNQNQRASKQFRTIRHKKCGFVLNN